MPIHIHARRHLSRVSHVRVLCSFGRPLGARMDELLWGVVTAGLPRVDRHAFAAVCHISRLVRGPYLEGEAVRGYIQFRVISIAPDQTFRQLHLEIARLQQTVAELRAERANLAEFGTGPGASEHGGDEARASR